MTGSEGRNERGGDTGAYAQYVAVFVYSEKNLDVRGPFDTYDAAKEYARTMSTDPDEALVVGISEPKS